MSVSDLQPSKLGTQTHWDSVYAGELANFHGHGDEGEIWFGLQSVEKMVKFETRFHSPPGGRRSLF
jgi:hypothetical protein